MKFLACVLAVLCVGASAKELIRSPAGGECYCPGTTQEVRLLGKALRIELSTDGGATWNTLGTPVKKVLHWIVPNVEAFECKVRILTAHGYEESFAFSIAVPAGSQGPVGPAGPVGPQGPAGADGEDGECEHGDCGHCRKCHPGQWYRHGHLCGQD